MNVPLRKAFLSFTGQYVPRYSKTSRCILHKLTFPCKPQLRSFALSEESKILSLLFSVSNICSHLTNIAFALFLKQCTVGTNLGERVLSLQELILLSSGTNLVHKELGCKFKCAVS